jgi:hypothetical protein
MEWKDNSSYIELGNIMSELTVTNDAAERIVKLGTNYAGIIIDTRIWIQHKNTIQKQPIAQI